MCWQLLLLKQFDQMIRRVAQALSHQLGDFDQQLGTHGRLVAYQQSYLAPAEHASLYGFNGGATGVAGFAVQHGDYVTAGGYANPGRSLFLGVDWTL